MSETSPLFLGIVSGERRRTPCRGRRPRRAHRRRTAQARRQAGRQRLHPDAQRHRLHRGRLCGDAARRLWRAGQLALQAGGDQLHPEGFRHLRADRPCRHAACTCAMRFPTGVTVLSVPTPPEILSQLQDRSRSSRRRRTSRSISSPGSRSSQPYDGPVVPQPHEHDLHLGHDRPSQGRAAQCADAGAERPPASACAR